jgi:hypothetical protein
MCERRWRSKWRPFAKDDGLDSGGYSVRLQSDKMWEERSGTKGAGDVRIGKVRLQLYREAQEIWVATASVSLIFLSSGLILL